MRAASPYGHSPAVRRPLPFPHTEESRHARTKTSRTTRPRDRRRGGGAVPHRIHRTRRRRRDGRVGHLEPSNLVQPLNEVWRHVESTYPDLYGFKNYNWDQVMANKGSLNYCVRWESDQPVTAQMRDQIHTALKRQSKKWIDQVAGFEKFPYNEVPVKIVGWAVKNRSTLQWSDNSVDIYTNVLDGGGAPQCAPDCGRFFHQDGNYSTCPGGAARHYDQSLWLTKSVGGGAGGDWGSASAVSTCWAR